MKTISKIFVWAAAGLVLAACEKPPVAQKAEALATAPVAKAEGKEYQIDAAKSSVLWVGTKKIGKHNGTIALKSGSVFVKDGAIVAGKFITDMKTIENKDLTGENHDKLVKHLRSPDFFDAEQFPEGIFEITSVSGKTINGNLTLKGKPYGISFEADVVFEKDAPKSAKTTFNIDRTKWGIVYPGMPDNLINDTINLTLDLKIKK